MPARRSGQAELRSFIEYAEPTYLSDHLELLAAPLGLTTEDVQQLRLLEPEEVARALRARLEGQRAASRAARARDAEERASAAASTLGATASWQGTSARLDIRALLIDLPAHPTARLIGFEGPGWFTVVARVRLREARAALGRKPDLEATVDADGLHLRWHEGRGGLDLRPVRVSPRGTEPILLVRLRPPVEPHVELNPQPAPEPVVKRARRRGGAWLGDVLGDLGLLG